MFPTFAAWWKANKWVAVSIAVILAGAAGWREYTFSRTPVGRGAAQARADFKKGVYMLRGHGYPSDCGIAYRELLEERFNITLYNQGCLVFPGEAEFDEAYNSVSKPQLIKRFGRDIFAETYSDACEKHVMPKSWESFASPIAPAKAENGKKGK